MARILVATHSASGHVRPFGPVVSALTARGHEVAWYTGSAYRAVVESAGAAFAEPREGELLDMDRLEDQFPEIAGLNDAARAAWFVENVFVAPADGHYRDLSAAFSDFKADVMLADSTLAAAGLLHEKEGRLWATLSIAPLAIPDPDVPPYGMGWVPRRTPLHRLRNLVVERIGQRMMFRKPLARMNRIRAGLDLPPVRSTFEANATPYLYMQATAAEFEYPRSSLRGLPVHFVGPLLPGSPRRFEPPPWWGELDGPAPVILVTQGTTARAPDQLIKPAIEALADSGLLVVVTTAAGLGDLPSNVRSAPFVPYRELMPKLAAVVTNGGYGTVQFALGHGLPVVAAGRSEDKPEVCARVAWSGAGVYLRSRVPAPRRLRGAVETVLRDPRYRENAGRIRRAFEAHDAPTEICALVERLVATGRPVMPADRIREAGP